MPWFKMFDEAGTDPKLESLTDAEHRIWFRLICFANKQEERGTITGYEDLDLLAVEVARGDTELLVQTLTRLRKLRIITWSEDKGNVTVFINFAKRQARKASDQPEAAAQRKREQRAREKQEEVDVTAPNEDVTPSSRDVTPPGARNMPNHVQADIALQAYLLQEARSIMTKNALSAGQRRNLQAWFTVHKAGLTREIIDYAVAETNNHTGGDSLQYLYQVLETRLSGKPRANGNGKGGTLAQAKAGEARDALLFGPAPPKGHSWDFDTARGWLPMERDPNTRKWPFGCETRMQAEEINRQRQREHDASSRDRGSSRAS